MWLEDRNGDESQDGEKILWIFGFFLVGDEKLVTAMES